MAGVDVTSIRSVTNSILLCCEGSAVTLETLIQVLRLT